MYTIKGRLLSAFLALGLLVVPFLIFSFISLKRINNVKDTREKVVAFNAHRLEAQAFFSRIQDYDLLTDNFYTKDRNTANVKDLDSSFQKGSNALKSLEGTTLNSNPAFKRRIEKLKQEILQERKSHREFLEEHDLLLTVLAQLDNEKRALVDALGPAAADEAIQSAHQMSAE